LYNGIYITRRDRTRWSNNNYDWSTPPTDVETDLDGPLSLDDTEIEAPTYNPVVVDIDGDGEKEIIFSGFDGKIHCFSLDKTEHDNWPFVVGTPLDIRYSSEPVVVDFDRDGKAEIVVTTWGPKTGGFSNEDFGTLLILDYQGNLLYTVNLPVPQECNGTGGTSGFDCTWAGGLAAPTIGNIDDTDDKEIVLVTTHAGIVAYTVPDSGNARILWGTGRGNQQRTGRIKRKHSGLSGLAIAGIVGGALAGVALIGGGIFLYMRNGDDYIDSV